MVNEFLILSPRQIHQDYDVKQHQRLDVIVIKIELKFFRIISGAGRKIQETFIDITIPNRVRPRMIVRMFFKG